MPRRERPRQWRRRLMTTRGVSADPKDGIEPWHEQTGHENDHQGHRQRAPAGTRCVLAVVSAATCQTGGRQR